LTITHVFFFFFIFIFVILVVIVIFIFVPVGPFTANFLSRIIINFFVVNIFGFFY